MRRNQKCCYLQRTLRETYRLDDIFITKKMQSTTSRISSAFSFAVGKFSNCGKLVLVIYVCFGILYIAASPSVLIKSHGIPNNINKNMKKQIQNENKQNVEQTIMLKHKPEFDYLNNFRENNNHHYEYKSSEISQIYTNC